MKKYFAALICCVLLLSGCDGSSPGPSSTVFNGPPGDPDSSDIINSSDSTDSTNSADNSSSSSDPEVLKAKLESADKNVWLFGKKLSLPCRFEEFGADFSLGEQYFYQAEDDLLAFLQYNGAVIGEVMLENCTEEDPNKPAKRVVQLALGDAEALRVGDSVIAIGNPLSMQFERTVTAGIISALNRTITVDSSGIMEDLIQTDASINPGNSGGPLINSAGEVIGINTIKVSSAEGMGFAVPINLCVPVIDRIRRSGEFHTPYLGLYAHTAEAARYLGTGSGFSRGLYVARLDSGGPAFDAGLRYGDVIMYADGSEVNTMMALRQQLFAHQPGESIRISYMRDGTLREAAVTLAAANSSVDVR